MPKGMNVGQWIVTVVLAVVLLAVLAGTYPTLIQQANSFKNATSGNSMAAILVTLLPILIAAGVLLAFVFGFLPHAPGHKSKY